MKLVIDRSKWRFGGDYYERQNKFGHTSLLSEEGYMCCLGFLSLECGYSEEDIFEIADPESMPNCEKYPSWLNRDDLDTKNCEELIRINDDSKLHSFEREKLLKEKFAENGVEVEFVGEYPTGI